MQLPLASSGARLFGHVQETHVPLGSDLAIVAKQGLKMGRAAGGVAGRSWGMGKVKKGAVVPELPGPVPRTGQAQEDQNSQYRDANHGNHRRTRSSGAGFTRSPQLP